MRSLLGVLLVLAGSGCGDDDDNINKLPDAPLFPDAPNDAPASGAVTLTVLVDGAGVANVPVYFQAADSSVVSATMTDANGVASAEMQAGGFVTAIDPFPQVIPSGVRPSDLRTFAGVKPGDQLQLVARTQDPQTTFTLVFEPDPNGVFFELHGSCLGFGIDVSGGGSAAVAQPLTLFGCTGTQDLLIVARDANFVPISSLYAPDTTLVEGGTVDLGGTFTQIGSATFAYAAVPSNITSINAEAAFLSARGPFFTTFTGTDVANNMAMTSPVERPVVPNVRQVTVSSFFGPQFGQQSLLEWGAPTAAYMLVMGNILNPTILMPDLTSDPVIDLPGHRVTWTTNGVGREPDFGVADLSFIREGQTAQFWDWQIAAPVGAATNITLPVLPAGPHAMFNPEATDLANLQNVVLVRSPGGYDAIRANVLAIRPDGSVNGQVGLVQGAAGTVLLQQLFRPQAAPRPYPVRHYLRPWRR